jgi:NAD-dependent dihydropyrimidine dehydrogenase PreA subunit
LREIIKINEEKCNGCGLCVPNCPEGAIQIIDGKARLVSDLFCDGLGACIGHCPEGAITIEKREAEPYSEKKTMENIVKAGKNTIIAHLKHLKEHNEEGFLKEALDILKEKNIEIKPELMESKAHHAGCPGSREMSFGEKKDSQRDGVGSRSSELKQWPVQLHLVNPNAPYYRKKDVLLAADCTAYAAGDFHRDFMKDKSLAIACPKLDSGKDIYLKKITAMIDEAEINTLTIAMMEVPCCFGLLQVAKEALDNAKRKIPLKSIIISIEGEILEEKWV